ncbi:MAG: hypothetical protein ACKOOI_10870, partial [Pirellula sp.]
FGPCGGLRDNEQGKAITAQAMNTRTASHTLRSTFGQDHLPTVEPVDFNRYRYDHGLTLSSYGWLSGYDKP